MEASSAPVPGLRVENVKKSYAGTEVLHGISLDVAPGDVVGLVGHNGAGKSTLLKIIAGATRSDDGRIVVDGVPATFGSPAAAIAAGIATVYQELSLLANLTVAQNVFLGQELSRRGTLDRREMRRQTVELAEEFGLVLDPDRRLGTYPVATRQLLEVAVAVHRDARYILLDEPTTSLEGRQVDEFLETVRVLASERQLGVVLVNHKLDELYAVANRIVALVDGEVRIDEPLDEIDRDQVVVAIAGEEGAVQRVAGDTTTADPAAPAGGPGARELRGLSLEVRNLRSEEFDDVSLVAHPGRVLGIYGLVGAGRTEVLRSLVGLERIQSGEILLDGKPFRPRGPAAAQRQGVVYLTEERKTDGIVPGLDCSTNVVLPILGQHRRWGLLDRRALNTTATRLMDQLRVRGDRASKVATLSGGNQQKVLIARALAQEPRVLLLDEPTKGVDLGVKAEIHRLIGALAHDEGLTVVVVSSEEDEVCEVADDMIVLSHGRSDGSLVPSEQRNPAALRRAAWDAA